MSLSKYIDHTLLKSEAIQSSIIKLCAEAKEYNFAAVCVNPVFVPVSKDCLKGSDVKVATVIGFPLGANTSYTKVKEAEKALSDGADELDMVMSVGLFKAGDIECVESDMKAVINLAVNHPVKVIIETCFLTAEEITMASKLAAGCGAAYVKTSTGFGPRGASLEDIKLIFNAIGKDCKIKASGGIKDAKFAKELIDAGASRIGTSSGVRIVKGG